MQRELYNKKMQWNFHATFRYNWWIQQHVGVRLLLFASCFSLKVLHLNQFTSLFVFCLRSLLNCFTCGLFPCIFKPTQIVLPRLFLYPCIICLVYLFLNFCVACLSAGQFIYDLLLLTGLKSLCSASLFLHLASCYAPLLTLAFSLLLQGQQMNMQIGFSKTHKLNP